MARTKRREPQRSPEPVKEAASPESAVVIAVGGAITTVGATLLSVFLQPKSPSPWAIGIAVAIIANGFVVMLMMLKKRRHSRAGTRKSLIDISKSKKKSAQTKASNTRAGNELQIARDKHLAIADTESTQSGSNPAPDTTKSPRAEGESNMTVVSTLPTAVDYHSTLSRLSGRLSALSEVPPVPQYIAPGAVFGWQIRVLKWLDEVQAILTSAVDLAIVRESNTYPSIRLTRATSRAEAALEWIENLAACKGESPDSGQLPRRCKEATAAIADILSYAASI